MAELTTQLAGFSMRNPVLTASGTFGYGSEYEGLVDFGKLGGITVKGVSPFPSHGNPMPRAVEVYGGMLNAIGLQNPGIDAFINDPHYLPSLRELPCAVIVNIWGRSVEQYAEVASRLEAEKHGGRFVDGRRFGEVPPQHLPRRRRRLHDEPVNARLGKHAVIDTIALTWLTVSLTSEHIEAEKLLAVNVIVIRNDLTAVCINNK